MLIWPVLTKGGAKGTPLHGKAVRKWHQAACNAKKKRSANACVSSLQLQTVSSLLPFAMQVGAEKELRTVIEGESLFNDGSAYVLFLLFEVSAYLGDQ